MAIMRKVHRSSSDCYKPLGCTSSIPVKYQTVVISNEEKKGFCSKSKRFLLEDSLVSYGGVDKITTISAHSVFLSKTKRNMANLNGLKGPSPCHYNVNDTITQKDPKVPYSCFKSNIARNPLPLKSEGPGPGAYNPYQIPEMVKRTILPRRHYLGLSAPPLKLSENPPLPGPGQYDIVNYEGSPKHFMSTAAFVSGTSRWVQNPKGHDVPGPGFYDPEIMSKRSFIYNHRKNWVPA
ncbi:O(6)-methylguanine-induced apoptosis 2 isoform X2 [Alosa alosa]|uniref:O(6)-methylguanine-induced apoptosis 2 isoform X2 n=1 Tax=Alosa alosa TaxID=278164 RepID=UPI00201545A3|nr:O(6)-methylguanine-induced apoptosis 2 isoform X2 [Alosa alosa]